MVLDLGTRRVVGWELSHRIDQDLTIAALGKALLRRTPAKGLILHSDRGVQYAGQRFRQVLTDHGLRQSMSRKGDCWDNAPMESFFATLKNECVHQLRGAGRRELYAALFGYIEIYYNGKRRLSAIGYLSPINYERTLKKA